MDIVFILIPIVVIIAYLMISASIENKINKRVNLKVGSQVAYHKRTLDNELEQEKKILKQENKKLENKKLLQDKLFEEKAEFFPWVAEMYSEYARMSADYVAHYLETKKSPALHAREYIREYIREYANKIQELEKKNFSLLGQVKYYEEKNKLLEDKILIQDDLFNKKNLGFPYISEMYGVYKVAEYESTAEYLETKKNPAKTAAESLRELSRKAKESEQKYFTTLALLRYYESLFPVLEDFQDTSNETILSHTNPQTENEDVDPAKKYLTNEEWYSLTKAERFQKSLDKYCNRHKSNWEIGREYERYIGHEHEKENWSVKYYGAIKGFEDLGRDLIATKGKNTKIIQCKYWAKDKTIHEKHIFQLYGTSILYMLDNRLLLQPRAIFVTSCSLSDTARRIAKYLDVEVIENKTMPDYPRIKCNIGKDNEKIYHLPFDQQYDKVKIEYNKGEFYCMTIEEAEKAGFRRAFRWSGN